MRYGVRILLTAGLAISCAAQADEIVKARPGLMCHSAEALSALTLPDGSARPDDAAMQSGGCISIPNAARITLVARRRNTSIVQYDAGAGSQTFVIPNIDVRRADGAPANLAPARTSFQSLMASNCPHLGWDRATASSFEGPLNDASAKLSKTEAKAMNDAENRECKDIGGMGCTNAVDLTYLIHHNQAREIARAFCKVKPETVP